MTRKPFEFKSCGLTLRGQSYAPKNIRGVIVLVHGMGEYSRRYENSVVPVLLKSSLAVVSYDQFGHGDSDGKRGDHPGYQYLLDSLDQVIQKAATLFPDKPLFLYGHSMGGNVVINYSLSNKNNLTGTIATSPFLKLAFDPPKWKMLFGSLISKIYPSLTMPNELDLQHLSKDLAEIEAYKNDPLIHDKISTRYSLEVIKKGAWAIANAGSLKTPMLILHGTKDQITSHLASKEFANRAKGETKFIPIQNGYHELHNDQEKEEVLNQILNWIDQKIN